MRIFLIAVLFLTGCSSYHQTIDDYMKSYPLVELGMSKEKIAEILTPSQRRLTNNDIKQPDLYMKDNVVVDIIYYRSGWQPDGLTTDDEFTPYIFNDNKLVAIGWQYLGGPKSQGQAKDTVSSSTSSVLIVY